MALNNCLRLFPNSRAVFEKFISNRLRWYSTMASLENEKYKLVEKGEMERFMSNCMLSVGTNPNHAKSLAACLVAADYRGHFSHGLNRLDMYVRDVKIGTTKQDGQPIILKESGATALIDGNNLLGPVVGDFCMQLAIKKAKDIGIGMVCARRSNHYGIAGFYSSQALEHGLIGMSFTNTSPIVFPTRSNTRSLGTNPITLAAPGKNGDSFILDMATSTVALGKVEINSRKDQGIPDSWGADESGHATTDPKKVLNGGGLLPLGGSEESGGYKGYGLSFMVEILCGILSGSLFGPNIRTWQTSSGEANLGQCFIAINPHNFEDNFEERLQSLMNHCRNMTPIDPSKRVMVPGDPERLNMKKVDEMNGIPYHINQIAYAENLARELNIEPPKSKEISL